MSQTNWEADKMLDVYIYDYLIKRNLHASAKAFQAEGKISTDPVAISAPGGFLFEWWSVFWDIFIARTNEKHSESAASYIETQLIKARELQQQQHQRPQQPQQQMQMQQLLLQRQAQQQQQQQQQRIETQSLNGTHNGLVGNEPFMRQNPGAANALARKMIEDRLKLPLQSDNLDEAILKQRFCDSMGQILDPNHTSVLKSAPVGGQPPGRTLQMPGGISGNPQQVQNRILQLPVSAKDVKSEMSPMMNLRAAGQEGSLIGVHGSNQGDNNLTLKGWPLTGLDQLRSGFFQQQKSSVQSPQPFHQLQLQQQLLLQVQQNRTSPSASELESRKNRMLLDNRSMSFGKDDNLNSVGDAIPNVGSPMQLNGTVMSRGDTDMLMKADMDRFVDDGSLEDNVESFLTPNEAYPRDTVGRSVDVSKGFTFTEFRIIPASAKVQCCHFSSDGKLLATGGHDKKAVLWCTQTFTTQSTLEEHSQMITDVCFSPSMPRLATSSADKTVRIWDADNPGYSLRNFAGHSAIVTSLDFHPSKEDLICSCDANGEIRYWSINNGNCARVFKGGMTQVRFQPRHGRYLAAAAEKTVSIIDVETQACRLKLQGHKNPVNSLCWDPSGEYLASVSEDVVKVWAFGSGSKGECINELSSSGSEFHSCVFHPTCTSLLVIGCYKSLELWNMNENKMMSLPAHDDVIASLAISNATGLVASASHDNCVKFWK